MLKTFTLSKLNIIDEFRFDAQFYYYNIVLKELLKQKGNVFNKLIDLSSVISDGEHSHIPRIKDEKNGVRYLYGRNIKEGIINFDSITDASYISKENYEEFNRIHLEENDVLLTIVGTVGKSAIYKKDYVGKAGIPRHIAKITVKKDSSITPEYLSLYFRSHIGKKQISSITTGNIQPLLAIKNIKRLDIPIPKNKFIEKITISESNSLQKEIAALNLLNESISIFYKSLDTDFSKTKTQKFFSINLSTFKESDLWIPQFSNPLYINTLKEIQKKFQTVPIGEICTIKKGDEVGSINYIEYIDKKESDIPFIRTTDLVNYECDQFPDFFIPESVYDELQQDIKEGDVLFTKDGKIGMTAMVTAFDKLIIASGLIRLRIKTDAIKKYGLTQEYLFTVLSIKETGFYPAKRRTVVASTIPHLREDRLKEIEIPILPKAKIDLITKKVKEAFLLKDEKKKLVKKVLKDIDEYFEK